MQRLLMIILLSSSIIFILSCSGKNQNKDKNQVPEIFLTVSSNIKNTFPQILKKNYKGKEIDALFNNLTTEGNEFCKMLYGEKTFNMVKAQKFIEKSQINLFRKMAVKGTIQTLIAGCWNFFVLNDSEPNLDFILVKNLYPKEKFDCFSVGMLQPYMMHNAMGCQTLTMLDIDWRILDGHRQLIKLFNKKLFQNIEKINIILKKMTLGWVAFSKPLLPKQPVNLHMLCQAYQHSLCKAEIKKFQENYHTINAIHLNLAGLHGGSYIKSQKENTIVVFLSNAIEKYYCTQEQFNQIITRIGNKLGKHDKAVLIYHVGGNPQRGIYEIRKNNNNNIISTVCKDIYMSDTVGGKISKPYLTYLDHASNTKKGFPSCNTIMQQFKRKQTK